MKVQNVTKYNQNYFKPNFKANPILNYKNDEFICDYISKVVTNEKGRLQSITYKYPLSVLNIFKKMENPKDIFATQRYYTHLHSEEEIVRIKKALEHNNEIGMTNVKSLIGYGAFAFVFETIEGLVLKITEGEHFPYGRKPEDFDLPIIRSGKISPNDRLYYYVEEKVRQDNMTNAEIFDLVHYIKSKGYVMRDYLMNFADEDDPNAVINYKQFGRASNGKIYLIDPGCVVGRNEGTSNSKNYEFLKKMLQKIRNLK